MQSPAKTPAQYLKSLPAERRKALSLVRRAILKSLPKGYKEAIQYGMLSYVVPLKAYPTGYLADGKTPLPYAALASQKHHMAVYLMCIYGNKENYEWFREEYKKTGKRLDMGKSCVRFRKLDDLPLPLIGKAIAKVPMKRYIEMADKEFAKRKRR